MYRFKLSVMMFLEFFIWGAWLPLIFGYLPSLGFDALQQGLILGAFNLAAFTAMFFSTQFADRNFSAEKFLAFSQLVGGLAILGLAFLPPGTVPVDPSNPTGPKADAPFWPFFLLMLVHSLFYVPTISITNSIAFANLKDPMHEFGPVRLWGTIGWIAASVPFVFILAGKTGADLREATRYTFVTAGVASLLLAGFSLFLPHTPPKPAPVGGEKLAWLEAMKLLKVPFLLVLFIVTFFDAAVHQCYFFWVGRFLESIGVAGNWVMVAMSISQVAEIGTMALLGVVLKKLGWRTTMVVGVLGHAVRFAVFASTPPPWMAIAINVVHGICYAFFFATVYIFVDEFFPKDARSSAQGLFNFLILGLGPFVGNFISGWLGETYSHREFVLPAPTGLAGAPLIGEVPWAAAASFAMPTTVVDFHRLFWIPAAVALGAALVLLVFFRPPAKAEGAGLPGHVQDALDKDAAFQAGPPPEGITDRDRPKPGEAVKEPDRPLPPGAISEP